MKNCIACNEPLEDDAKFCSECRVEQPERLVESQEAMVTMVKSQKNISVISSSKEEEKMDYSSKCNSSSSLFNRLVGSNYCYTCTHSESIDDRGYYWCNHHKTSFKFNSVLMPSMLGEGALNLSRKRLPT